MAQTGTATKIQLSKLSLVNMSGEELDIREAFVSLNIYEDIFCPFLTGKLILIDSHDVERTFPVIGNEKLTVAYKNEVGNNFRYLNFAVYKVNRDPVVHKEMKNVKYLELYLISEEGMRNNLLSISRKFTGTGKDIIEEILYNYLNTVKEITCDETANDLEVYSNYWKPSQLIDFVSRFSKSETAMDYLFFENLDGFQFRSLSSLLLGEAANDRVFYFDTFKLENFADKHSIKAHAMSSYFDHLNGSKVGMMGSTFFQPDMTNYGYEVTSHTAHDASQYGVWLGNYFNLPEDLLSNMNDVQVHYADALQSSIRNIFMSMLNNYNWVIKMSGDSDRSAGSIFKVKFPQITKSKTHVDRMMDGNWLATRINHEIQADSTLLQKINLVKNAFNTDDRMNETNGRTNVA